MDKISHEERCFIIKEAAKWYKRLSEEGLQLAESKGLIGPATWAKESEGLARGNAALIKDHNIFVAHHGGGSRLDKALDLSGIPAKYKENMKGSLNTAGFTSLPPQDLTSTTPITVSSLRPNSAFVKTIDDHLASEKGADPSYFFGNLNRTESLHGGRLMLRHEIDELRTSREHLRKGNYVSIRPNGVDRAVIPGTSAGNHASAKVVAEELSSVKGAPPALRKAFTNIRSYKNEYGRIEDGLPSPTRKDLLYSASKLDSVDIPNSIQQNLDRYAYQGAKKGKPMIKEAAKWYKRLSEEGLQLAESKGLIGPATWAKESEGIARGNANLIKEHGIIVAHANGGSRKSKALEAIGVRPQDWDKVSDSLKDGFYAKGSYLYPERSPHVFVQSIRSGRKFTDKLDNALPQGTPKFKTLDDNSRKAVGRLFLRHEIDEARSIKKHVADNNVLGLHNPWSPTLYMTPHIYGGHGSYEVIKNEYSNMKGLDPTTRQFMQGMRSKGNEYEIFDELQKKHNPSSKHLSISARKGDKASIPYNLQDEIRDFRRGGLTLGPVYNTKKKREASINGASLFFSTSVVF